MALIYEGITCAICDKEMDLNSEMFATSGVCFPPDHRLFTFCDAPMHWECYARWPDRAEFARGYFQGYIEGNQENPYWGVALVSEDVFVSVNPQSAVAKVSVCLAETGIAIHVPLRDWTDWLESIDTPLIDLHPMELAALRKVRPLLQSALPNTETLLDAVDWAGKQAVLNRCKERARQDEEERLRRPKTHNKACRALLRQGVRCLHCSSEFIQYVDQSPEAKSYFTCGDCGETFGPVEVILDNRYG